MYLHTGKQVCVLQLRRAYCQLSFFFFYVATPPPHSIPKSRWDLLGLSENCFSLVLPPTANFAFSLSSHLTVHPAPNHTGTTNITILAHSKKAGPVWLIGVDRYPSPNSIQGGPSPISDAVIGKVGDRREKQNWICVVVCCCLFPSQGKGASTKCNWHSVSVGGSEG